MEQVARVKKTVRALQCWTTSLLVAFGLLLHSEPSLDNFYKLGPSSTLIIMGITLDTIGSYSGIMVYCLINTVIRNLNNQIVVPWITLVVHDTTISKDHLSYFFIQEIVMMSAFYCWVDWFIYINIVFSQIDVVLMELFSEVVITYLVTRMYLTIDTRVFPAVVPE